MHCRGITQLSLKYTEVPVVLHVLPNDEYVRQVRCSSSLRQYLNTAVQPATGGRHPSSSAETCQPDDTICLTYIRFGIISSRRYSCCIVECCLEPRAGRDATTALLLLYSNTRTAVLHLHDNYLWLFCCVRVVHRTYLIPGTKYLSTATAVSVIAA